MGLEYCAPPPPQGAGLRISHEGRAGPALPLFAPHLAGIVDDAEISFVLQLLGLPHDTVAGFRDQVSQERGGRRKLDPLLRHSLRSHTLPLSPQSWVQIQGEGTDPTSQWEAGLVRTILTRAIR